MIENEELKPDSEDYYFVEYDQRLNQFGLNLVQLRDNAGLNTLQFAFLIKKMSEIWIEKGILRSNSKKIGISVSNLDDLMKGRHKPDILALDLIVYTLYRWYESDQFKQVVEIVENRLKRKIHVNKITREQSDILYHLLGYPTPTERKQKKERRTDEIIVPSGLAAYKNIISAPLKQTYSQKLEAF